MRCDKLPPEPHGRTYKTKKADGQAVISLRLQVSDPDYGQTVHMDLTSGLPVMRLTGDTEVAEA